MTPVSEDVSPPGEGPIPLWEQLDRYMMGEATDAERGAVERWMETSPEGRRIVAHLQATLRGKASGVRSGDLPSEDVRVRIEQILATAASQSPSSSVRGGADQTRGENITVNDLQPAKAWSTRYLGRGKENGERPTLRQMIWTLGAIAMVAMVWAGFRSVSSPARVLARNYTTGMNQEGMITLDDGTRVILAPQTTLRLLSFSAQTRVVSIDGKAHFDVVHAEGAPFEVRSGSVTARVLGTAFLVDHEPASARVRIAVEEGRVRVLNTLRPNADFTVTKGYVGEITDSSQVMIAVDSTASTEWFHGQLVFHHVPVATVLQTLSRWYGYQFRYTDSTLSERNVTVGLSVRSPALALATLEQLLRVNLIVQGDTITLAPQVEGRRDNMSRIRSYDVWTPTREVGR